MPRSTSSLAARPVVNGSSAVAGELDASAAARAAALMLALKLWAVSSSRVLDTVSSVSQSPASPPRRPASARANRVWRATPCRPFSGPSSSVTLTFTPNGLKGLLAETVRLDRVRSVCLDDIRSRANVNSPKADHDPAIKCSAAAWNERVSSPCTSARPLPLA